MSLPSQPARRGPLLFLSVETYGKGGGVPSYSRRIAEILTAYGAERRQDLISVSLTDQEPDRERHSHEVNYRRFHGAAGSIPKFLWHSARAGLERPSLAVAGHIGQAPVAWALRRAGLLDNYIVVLHGIECWQPVAGLDLRAIREAAAIVTTTQFTTREFLAHNRVAERLFHVIPLALGEAELAPLEPHVRGGRWRILTVGRLASAEGYKGVDTLIEATARLRARDVPVSLSVVGRGDDLGRLEGIRDSLGLKDEVEFLGAVPDAKLDALFQSCDVFAMPSKGEGFGLVFLEAMRYAKPCIGGNHGGTPEVIDHGDTGFLVDYGDVESLTTRLYSLYQDGALAAAMGLRGYDKVKRRYLYPHMRDDWFRLMDLVQTISSQ